ncbi:MAG: hypothetical protein WCF06_05045 [Nitrososphaeraceae archaeon]
MDYDVTKISQLQLDKHEQIAPPPSPPPTTTSKSTINHPSSPSDNSNQVQNDNHLHFEFWLPVHEVLRHLIPIIVKKGHNEKQYGLAGFLTKVSVRLFRLLSEEYYHKMTW